MRQPIDERDTITALANGYVPTSTGRSIPLGQIAKASFTWEPGVLWREGRDYAATVQGDIVEGLQGATVTAQLDPLFKTIRDRMLPGYRIEVAGAVGRYLEVGRTIGCVNGSNGVIRRICAPPNDCTPTLPVNFQLFGH